MTFNTLLFIFMFLPIAILVDRLLPKVFLKNIWLFLISLVFYGWGNWKVALLLFILVVWNYLSAIEFDTMQPGKARTISFWVSVGVNLAVLTFYKLLNVGIDNFPLPVGLSFYLFSSISYLADVYMHKTKANHNFIEVGLYIGFFGKLLMGPIEQYADMADQLAHRKGDMSGSVLFIRGLAKKVALADQFAIVYGMLTSNHSFIGTWLMVLAFSLQLYFDFSGYSDMAIGISRIFGFQIHENFNHPYIAKNAQDFWRRWHISLSKWFRNYVYIPLKGNRCPTPIHLRNIFIVWFFTGIWHGLNGAYLAWAMYYAIILILEEFYIRKALDKMPSFVSHIYAIVIIAIGWVFFMSGSLSESFQTLGRMFAIGTTGMMDTKAVFMLTSYFLFFVVGIIFSMPVFDSIEHVLYKYAHKWGIVALYVLLFVVCLAFIVGSSFQTFLYAAF